MSSPRETGSTNLTQVAVYRRTVRASLDRIWENVLDWEHLPWLHRESFSEIQLQQAGAWGWRARAVTTQNRELAMELLVERDASRYVARTVEGEGAGTEIWTRLLGGAPHETEIEVEFWLPDIPADAVETIGAAYTRLYTRLWDEDEEMMYARSPYRAQSTRRSRSNSASSTDSASRTSCSHSWSATRFQTIQDPPKRPIIVPEFPRWGSRRPAS